MCRAARIVENIVLTGTAKGIQEPIGYVLLTEDGSLLVSLTGGDEHIAAAMNASLRRCGLREETGYANSPKQRRVLQDLMTEYSQGRYAITPHEPSHHPQRKATAHCLGSRS